MLTSIELFTGAGGLALGVAAAEFEHRLLVEYNRDACHSLRHNMAFFKHEHPAPRGHARAMLVKESTPAPYPDPLHEGDVAGVDFTPHHGLIDLIAAGAPCQPFSIGGKHRAHDDERNLFPNVFAAVRDVAPRAVIVENVKGLLRASFAPYVEYIELQLAMPECQPDDPEEWQAHVRVLRERQRKQARLTKGGRALGRLSYRVTTHLLQAANFGVPQKRERAFIVAIREDLGEEWPGLAPTHSEDALLYAQWVTGEYWERHGIRKPKLPDRLTRRVERLRAEGPPPTKPWRTVRDALRQDPPLPDPKPYQETPGILNHVGQLGARTYPGHTGSPIDEPAKTLKAGVHGVPGGENCLRYPNGEVRYFTVREAARLQTFPDGYEVRGAWGEALRQLGNAVPVDLAKAVADSVRAILERHPETRGVPRELSAPRAKTKALGAGV